MLAKYSNSTVILVFGYEPSQIIFAWFNAYLYSGPIQWTFYTSGLDNTGSTVVNLIVLHYVVDIRVIEFLYNYT